LQVETHQGTYSAPLKVKLESKKSCDLQLQDLDVGTFGGKNTADDMNHLQSDLAIVEHQAPSRSIRRSGLPSYSLGFTKTAHG